MDKNPNLDAKTQNMRILKHLKAGKTITALQALRQFGCLRLSARIYDLKQLGHEIEGEFVLTAADKRVKKYRLA